MKKPFLITTLCLGLGVGSAQTQIYYGVKAGLNLATVAFNADYDADFGSDIGYYVGPYATVGLTDRFNLRPELLLSHQGYNYDHPSFEEDPVFHNTYLNLPIMVRYSAIDRLQVEAGPQIGFLIGSKLKFEDETEDSKDTFKAMDFGFNIGAGYRFPIGLAVELRYNFGLGNISEDLEEGAQSVKNRVFSFGISYTLSNEP